MRVKICGITKVEQGIAIASLGASALGFICVAKSPRYIAPDKIRSIVEQLPEKIAKIGVFANATPQEIAKIIAETGLNGVQLHGDESPQYCDRLKELLATQIELIKAFRIESSLSLSAIASYTDCVDTLLLDAYNPNMLGGTGQTLNWSDLEEFKPSLPWLLAGGLTPNNILDALDRLKPNGIDLSSGVERSPGDKDLAKVTHLFKQIKTKME